MTKRLKRPRDPVQLGKLIGDILTGQVQDAVEDKRNPAAVMRGHKGGIKGGIARAESLTGAERKKIARMAAKRRWSKAKERQN